MYTCAFHSLFPALDLCRPVGFFHVGLKYLVDGPVVADVFQTLPVAHSKACQICSAQSGGFDALGTVDLTAQNVG